MASEITVFDSIGTRIERACNERNLKKKELAEAIGCGGGHLSDIVTDKQKPSLELLTKISSTLDKPADYFLTGQTSYVIQEEFLEIV